MIEDTSRRPELAVIALLAAAALLTLPFQPAVAQGRADTVAITRATLLDISDSANAFAKKFSALIKASGETDFILREGNPRIGLELRLLDHTEPIIFRPWLPNSRVAALHREILAGTAVTSAAPLESLPRICIPAMRRGAPREYCALQDFDIVLAFSQPRIAGSKASIVVRSWANSGMAGQPLSQSLSLHSLERINNQWKVVGQRPLFTS